MGELSPERRERNQEKSLSVAKAVLKPGIESCSDGSQKIVEFIVKNVMTN